MSIDAGVLGRVVSPPLIVDLVDAVEQVGRGDAERGRESDDGGEPRVASAAFEERDLGAVQVAEVSERLLRQPLLEAVGA
jgi:hypothetical protein